MNLRPGYPAAAYELGKPVMVVRPSFQKWGAGMLPAAGMCLLLIVGGLLFAVAFVSEPFAFLLKLGWFAYLVPVVFPVIGLCILGSHLARNLRGVILVLDGGVVLVTGLRSEAKVYKWSDLQGFQTGRTHAFAREGARFDTTFAPGSEQFNVQMADGVEWVFGSDLDRFTQLQEFFRQGAPTE